MIKENRRTLDFFLLLVTILFVFTTVRDAEAKQIVSMQDYAETCAGGERANLMLDRMIEMGATMIRMNVNHMNEENCQWLDTFYRARIRGLQVHLTLGSWTTQQAAEIVNAVKGQVSYYSVWNEPNHPHTWNDASPISSGRAKQYVNWFRKIYKVIHNRDRQKNTKVLFGEYAPDKGSHLRRSMKFINKRKPIRAEGLAIHPYTFPNTAKAFRKHLLLWRSRSALVAQRHRICRAGKGCKPLPIYITEMATVYKKINPVPLWKVACQMRLPMMMQYQMRPTGQNWDTSILNADMSPTNRSENLRRFLNRSRCTK